MIHDLWEGKNPTLSFNFRNCFGSIILGALSVSVIYQYEFRVVWEGEGTVVHVHVAKFELPFL